VFEPASSAGSGIIAVSPVSINAQAVGTTFTIQIFVHGMSQFNGWDIQIVVDNMGIVNATGLSITNNIFSSSGGQPVEIVHCLNGQGSGCTASDGKGIVHSAYGNTAFVSGDGLLFTITYQVVTALPYTAITIRNDLISSSNPSGVPHTTQFGAYGAPVSIGGGGSRDMAL
jgi:hypothetical protein